MLYSKNQIKKQTIQSRGHLVEVEVELRDKQGALAEDLAITKRERENDGLVDTSSLHPLNKSYGKEGTKQLWIQTQ